MGRILIKIRIYLSNHVGNDRVCVLTNDSVVQTQVEIRGLLQFEIEAVLCYSCMYNQINPGIHAIHP